MTEGASNRTNVLTSAYEKQLNASIASLRDAASHLESGSDGSDVAAAAKRASFNAAVADVIDNSLNASAAAPACAPGCADLGVYAGLLGSTV